MSQGLTSSAPRREEQTFFSDPALDRAVGMIMSLAAELYVAKDRMRCLERVLEQRGLLASGELDAYEPSPEERAETARERDAFVAGLLEQIIGVQSSRGMGQPTRSGA